ncbi:type II toxin-antitoxin system MqsA family antitoxin [Hydrogenophaga sp.]|uniref:type II toxin-antitoxin system MqsA family antitoxin n=1 Tax=Hydrogenophaga sp. TaxID=1904254 RepID=UPI00271E46C6|nr:type II toxin-antitoxin system MqsA family antitoxin [Hydrogenophaga sp.]MDO9438049.1 type II toxin-antitoxin system MqsA family antitoxin [Hydrogenophaga sp.]
MRCPHCEVAELVSDNRNVPYTFQGKTTTIPAVSGKFCPACGEAVFEAAESIRLSAAMLALNENPDSPSTARAARA